MGAANMYGQSIAQFAFAVKKHAQAHAKAAGWPLNCVELVTTRFAEAWAVMQLLDPNTWRIVYKDGSIGELPYKGFKV